MSNNFFSEFSPFKKKPANQTRSPTKSGPSMANAPFNERTANWPDVPGKTQSRDRSGGVKKAKIHASAKGL